MKIYSLVLLPTLVLMAVPPQRLVSTRQPKEVHHHTHKKVQSPPKQEEQPSKNTETVEVNARARRFMKRPANTELVITKTQGRRLAESPPMVPNTKKPKAKPAGGESVEGGDCSDPPLSAGLLGGFDPKMDRHELRKQQSQKSTCKGCSSRAQQVAFINPGMQDYFIMGK